MIKSDIERIKKIINIWNSLQKEIAKQING